jgi:hypothetical protein
VQLAVGLAAAWVATACGDSTDPGPPPVFQSASVAGNSVNTISAIVTVEAVNYDSARIRYFAEAVTTGSTPNFAFAGDSVLELPVLGLEAATSYSFELVLTWSGRPDAVVDTLSFTTGSLPDWVPLAGATGSDTTPGFLALSYPGGPVIVDNGGRVVWYKTAPDGTLNSFHAHANGFYTLLGRATDPREYQVLDVLGREVETLDCVGRPIRFHDFLVLEGGDYWALCDENRITDLSEFGGMTDAIVNGTVVQHISAAGELLFEWKVLDHFDITDTEGDLTGEQINFSHGNALAMGEDGNLIVSFRNLNEITKIDTETGDVIWRFGGLRNQFSFVNDPKGSFQRQHGVSVAGPNQIQFLDNSETPPSRLVRYVLDEAELTATLIFAFADGPDVLTPVGGNSQYFPSNGHGLVSFGRAGRVVETDAMGNRAWELTGIDGLYVFRAQRIPSLYFPGGSP